MTAADLIRKFEGDGPKVGDVLVAYPDPFSQRAKNKRATGVDDPSLDGRPWTIGRGCTGPGIVEGLQITQDQGDQMFEHRLAALMDSVNAMIRVPVNANQLAALYSFAWNEGTHHLVGSTLLRLFNAGDVQGAADQFLMWERADHEKINGLVTRREFERDVFLGKVT